MKTRGKWILGGVVALALVGGVLFGLRLRTLSEVGAGFVAKQMCSCLFVGARSFASCRSDMLPSMDRVRAETTPEGDGVRAWVPLLAERVARHHEGAGCTLY